MASMRSSLLDTLIQEGYLKTPRIIEAFRAVQRADFLPASQEPFAEANEPLSIGYGQTCSQPLTVAILLELLDPRPGQKILDVGSGSGWTSALLAHVVSSSVKVKMKNEKVTRSVSSGLMLRKVAASKIKNHKGRIYAVEIVPELCAFGQANIEKYDFLTKGVVEYFCKDASAGLPERAPFDRILSGAAADALPEAWREQLKTGGRIVAPLRSSVWLFEKVTDGSFREKEYPGFAFVPLVGKRT